MNIEELTIGQGRELAALFTNQPKNTFLQKYIGKWVICRTRNEGINFGKVKEADDTGVVLENARRIWYHKPADTKTTWYEGVAVSGLHRDSKVSVAVTEKVIIEDYSLTLCADAAVIQIQNHPAHEQG